MKKLKGIETDEFAKLPETTIYYLKIEILGQRKPLIFKSKSMEAINQKLRACCALYGEDMFYSNEIEVYTDSFKCKDTDKYYDINGVYDSINSFRGEYI